MDWILNSSKTKDQGLICALLLLFLTVCFGSASAQLPAESQQYYTEMRNSKTLDKSEWLPEFDTLDLGFLWTDHNNDVRGFVGDGYQRIYVKYLAIIRNADDPTKYYVYGKRRVKSDVRRFLGVIELMHVWMVNDPLKREIFDNLRYTDSGEAVRYSKDEYVLIARYDFCEDSNVNGTGVLRGIMRTDFYVDNGRVLYNDLYNDYDTFCNNQCVGTWTSYVGGTQEKCNWGEWL